MTCCSELFEIKSGDEIKTSRDEVVPGAAAEVEDADFSTDTARANGPLGSESCRWGCCRFVFPQLWSEDCASGVTVKPPGVPLGYVMLVASGKNVSVWARSLVIAWLA